MTGPIRVCVVGSANVDLTFRSSRLPSPGETVTGHDFQRGFGGKGANQAVAAARLGAHVHFLGRLGNDSLGQEYRQHFQTEHIDTTFVGFDGVQPTGSAAILVDDQGRNCIVVIPGANGNLTPAEIRAASHELRAAHAVLAQLETPLAATVEAFRIAQAAGVTTILTPAPAVALPQELLDATTICIPNQSELQHLTGNVVNTLAEVELAGQLLRSFGPKVVIVTLGERGAFVLEGNEAYHLPALPVRAVDTTGAGDAFTAALAVFLSEGNSLRASVHRACAVAAFSVQLPGTHASYPLRETFDREYPTIGLDCSGHSSG